MNDSQTEAAHGPDRWFVLLGGAAGILGTVFVFLYFNVGPDPPGFCTVPMAQCLQTVADNRSAFLLKGALGIGAALFDIVFLVVLYRIVRSVDWGIGQVGAVLGIFGFFVLGILAGTSVASGANLATLYVNASPADKGTIVSIAQGVTGVVPGGLFWIDTLLRAFGVAALGAAMVKSTNFGTRYGVPTAVVGLLYLPLDFGGTLFDPLFVVANLVFFIWLAVLGWKLTSLSRKS